MNDVQTWIQAVSTVFIALTFIVYFFQLRTMRRAAEAQNILAVVNHLQDPEARAARRVVLTELKDKPLASWTKEDKRASSLVYATYDVAGILIQRGLVPRDIFISNWGESIVRSFEVLEPYLKEIHTVAPGTKYGMHLKWLSEEAQRAGMGKGV
jgi:hypothetical protein